MTAALLSAWTGLGAHLGEPIAVAGATWLHLAATVVVLGYYALVPLVVLPALRRFLAPDGLGSAIAAIEGVTFLDQHSDVDHNRTVLTFAGSPVGVEEAAFRAIKTASELIDLNQHTGAHPRIGATDVVPFVPLSGVSMDDCIAIAKRLGQRVGSELNIPVYLYEAAATRPERTNLENIRKAGFAGADTFMHHYPAFVLIRILLVSTDGSLLQRKSGLRFEVTVKTGA